MPFFAAAHCHDPRSASAGRRRPVVPPPFELRFETPPGQQAQFQTEFTDEPGVIRIVWLFSLQDLPTMLRCHIAAFEALGGVPQQILYDRMKTAVIGDDAEAGHISTIARCWTSRGPTGAPSDAAAPNRCSQVIRHSLAYSDGRRVRRAKSRPARRSN
jgi:hypothetical protein